MDVSTCEEGSSDAFLRRLVFDGSSSPTIRSAHSGTATGTRVEKQKQRQQLDNTAPSRCVAFRLPSRVCAHSTPAMA